MAMRLMYDSVNPRSIPSGADFVAGYGNGVVSRWPDDALKRFTSPSLVHAMIDTNGSDPEGCGVLDVERFDATNNHAAAWIQRRLELRRRAVLYTSRSNVSALIEVIGHYRDNASLWVADWTGQPHTLDVSAMHVVAVQFRHTDAFDLSAVFDDEWHPQPS